MHLAIYAPDAGDEGAHLIAQEILARSWGLICLTFDEWRELERTDSAPRSYVVVCSAWWQVDAFRQAHVRPVFTIGGDIDRRRAAVIAGVIMPWQEVQA